MPHATAFHNPHASRPQAGITDFAGPPEPTYEVPWRAGVDGSRTIFNYRSGLRHYPSAYDRSPNGRASWFGHGRRALPAGAWQRPVHPANTVVETKGFAVPGRNGTLPRKIIKRFYLIYHGVEVKTSRKSGLLKFCPFFAIPEHCVKAASAFLHIGSRPRYVIGAPRLE